MNVRLLQAVEDHPRAVKMVTVGLIMFAGYNFIRAITLHNEVTAHIRQVKSDAARAASEALGG